MGITYKDSGVNIHSGNSFVQKIAPLVKSTFTPSVITGIGGFGALYSGVFSDCKDPVLVSGTDGVGTKLKIAQMCGCHNTIGIDAVAMCVNDILTSGAQPLFFLDYIACGKLVEDTLVQVVQGMVEGCRQSNCSLIGGETAEHPNVMADDDYDIAGFSVGVVDREKIIDGSRIKPGDVIIGLPSSGIHSNGYSLVRKLFFDLKKYTTQTTFQDLDCNLGEALLIPTRIYVSPVISALQKGLSIKGIVHITGGGFYENIPRILPEGTSAILHTKSIQPHPLFGIIQREGRIESREMYTTFNMGIGLMLVVAAEYTDTTLEFLSAEGEKPAVIGSISGPSSDPVIITD